MANLKDEEISEFVSPFLLMNDKGAETVVVTPMDPGKNRKVYVVKKEPSLAGQNYIQCSACHHRALRLFRSVSRAIAPSHLRCYGNTDTDILRFCRSCWYRSQSEHNNNGTKAEWLKHPQNNNDNGNFVSSRPSFERCPLGVTDQRACFGWHFIQRDFVRQKVFEGKNKKNEMLPLVSVLGQEGNEFVKRENVANHFNRNGKEVSLHNESGYESNSNSPTSSGEVDSMSNILMNIQRDHDYAPAVQREVEVTTSAKSPVKSGYQSNNQRPNGMLSRTGLKVCQSKGQVHQTANKLLKKAVMFEGHQKQSKNSASLKMPVAKVEELKTKGEKCKKPDPNHLMGLKATAEDGQTLPGLICPLCGRHTVKSYSVWKKEKAPQKIKHLFKDGVTVIRACRKCVPYPPNRDRRLNDKVSNGRLTSSQSQGVKSQQKTNGKRGYECLENSKNETKDRLSKIEIQASKVKKNDLVFVNVGVKVARVNGNNARIERLKNGKNSKTLEDSDEDIVKKKARIEEKKRKIEIASGGELTGLECFESLPAEERINDHENWKIEEMKRSEDWLSCSEKDAKNNISSKEKDFKARPPKTALMCDTCSSSLGKTFRTIKQSKCPKRFAYFFKQNKTRRSMRVCKNCMKK